MTSFQKFIVASYRYLAAVVLLLILGSAFAYALVTSFYGINSTWIAPVIISQTNEKILQIKAESLRMEQTLATITTSISVLEAEARTMMIEIESLNLMLEDTLASTKGQVSKDKHYEMELSRLSDVKKKNNDSLRLILGEFERQAAMVNADLAAGLITRDEASRSLLMINGAKSSATDAEIAISTISRQALELRQSAQTLAGGKAQSLQALDFLYKTTQIKNQITELKSRLAENQKESGVKKEGAQKIRNLLTELASSPYYIASVSKGSQTFAFSPYENRENIAVGDAVYDCMLEFLICSKAGTVERLFNDEETAQHPLFHQEMRGALLEVKLTDASAAKSRVLFVKSAPLLF